MRANWARLHRRSTHPRLQSHRVLALKIRHIPLHSPVQGAVRRAASGDCAAMTYGVHALGTYYNMGTLTFAPSLPSNSATNPSPCSEAARKDFRVPRRSTRQPPRQMPPLLPSLRVLDVEATG